MIPVHTVITQESALSPLEKAAQLIASDPVAKVAEDRILELLIHQRKSLLLTGKAGTGKTTLIASVVDKLQKHLAQENKQWLSVKVTALTGLAGMLIPGGIGTTMHSCLGIQFNKTRDNMEKFLKFPKRKIIANIGYLIIDEVSMLSAELLTEIDAFLRIVRKRDFFMGGIPTLFSGDFLQLSPVNKDMKEMYIFQARVFERFVLPNTVYLSTSRRQSETEFLNMLNELRLGQCGAESRALLKSRDVNLHRRELDDSPVKPTRLYSTNKLADAENTRELAKLPGEKRVFMATHCAGKENKKTGALSFTEISPTERNELSDISKFFDENTLVPQTLELKVGAQVIYLRSDGHPNLKNGSRGVVTEFDEKTGLPIVDFVDVGKMLLGQEDNRRSSGEPGAMKHYSRRQIPLKLAWALTIHKSQGMTMDMVIVYFPDAFCPAQIYVAISRVKTLAGLYVVGFNPNKITADKTVLAFYSKLDPDVKKFCEEKKISLEYPIFDGDDPVVLKRKRTGGDDDNGDCEWNSKRK